MSTLAEDRAMGRRFTWGPIVAVHEIGPYAFIEHQARVYENHVATDRYDGTSFAIYVDGQSICQGSRDLDRALALAIAYRHDGCNSRAAQYFMRMLRQEDEE